ncbi:dienelactone hydrolase family protein [Kitasatospora sp. NPDC001660]
MLRTRLHAARPRGLPHRHRDPHRTHRPDISRRDSIRRLHRQPGNLRARPTDALGVVVLPDVRGLYGFYQQLAIALAHHGHPSAVIDYYGRTAGIGTRGDDFPFMDHAVRTSEATVQADLRAAADHLRTLGGPAMAGVASVGFCFGGRHAFLSAAPAHGLAAAVGFYGVPGIAGPYGPGPTQRASELTAPILGIFGGADPYIPPGEVGAFDSALTASGTPHHLVSYPDAPHSFFDVSHDDKHAEASRDAWNRTLAFLRNPAGYLRTTVQ